VREAAGEAKPGFATVAEIALSNGVMQSAEKRMIGHWKCPEDCDGQHEAYRRFGWRQKDRATCSGQHELPEHCNRSGMDVLMGMLRYQTS
jgi:hypothetical protein